MIEGLEATKKAVKEINEAVEVGKVTEKQIDEAREVYRPAASESAMLYFMLTNLNSIDHMYQYSLDAFVFFFFKGESVRASTTCSTDGTSTSMRGFLC